MDPRMAFNSMNRPGGRKLPPKPSDAVRSLLAAGRWAEAEKKLRLLRKTAPRDPDILNFSGIAALQLGQADAALDHFGKAAALAPGRADIQHHLGEAARLCSAWETGRDAFRKALTVNQGKSTSWRGLGLCLIGTGEFDEAVKALSRALSMDPKDGAALLKLAEAQAGAGQMEAALASAARAADLMPAEAGARNNYGVLLLQAGEADKAVAELEAAVAAAPGRTDYLGNLAAACRAAGRFDAALDHYDRAIATGEAPAAIHAGRASLLEYLNRLDEAGQAAEQALTLEPGNPQALLTAAMLDRRAKDHEAALEKLAKIPADAGLGFELDASRHFEAATCLDRLGRHDEAWEAYTACNRVHDASPPAHGMDRDAFFRDIVNARESFTPGRVAAWPDRIDDGAMVPAFLVGFPRSGTTLTEQVLAAHPRLVATDERELVREVIRKVPDIIGRPFEYPRDIDAIGDEHLPALRAAYSDAVRAWFGGDPGERMLLDKLPLNLVHLGFIRRIFPEAKILIALRDPRDVCLSAYFQNFHLNTAMIQFLDIARCARAYHDAMGLLLHFEEILGLQTLRFRYEDVVGDLKGEASRILAFLGLDWTDEITAFAEKSAKRAISTPSARDVASGLYTRALGRHRHYAAQLAPVMDDLRPFVEALGYPDGGKG
jgi:tetratricopeptide (TPR) repeat protein